MNSFTFQHPTKIIFGKGTEKLTASEVAKYSKKVLLHYGGGSIKKSGLYDIICNALKEAGIEYVELPGAQPNPRLSLVKQGIEICRKENISFILAVGGGSVIDSAKAIAVGVEYSGDVWDFFIQKASINSAIPVGVVLTIPAAGSEASNSCVITNEEGWQKRAIGSELIRPVFGILNPEFTLTLSVEQTMIGIADIMAHLFERYFTQVPNVDLTDRMIEATLRSIIINARILFNDPLNLDARAEIMMAGTFAHNDLFSCGRIGDWGSHLIEHELSAIYDVPHGAGLSIVFPAWMKYVYQENPLKFAQFAHRVWDVEANFEDPETTALEGIKRFKTFLKEIGLPTSMAELNIPSDKIEEMASKCAHFGLIGNFKKLNQEDIINVFRLAK